MRNPFTVIISRRSEKEINQLEDCYYDRVIQLLEKLALEPVPVTTQDVCKISGTESDYRIRVGPFRVLYTVQWNEKEIQIKRVERKKDRTYR